MAAAIRHRDLVEIAVMQERGGGVLSARTAAETPDPREIQPRACRGGGLVPGDAIRETDELLFAEPTPPFDKKEELQGVTFQVLSPNLRSGNRLTVTPSGLGEVNTPIEMDVTGIITRTEVADINADGSPELYVFGFDGTSQTVLAWSANRKKSLSDITLPDLDAAQSKGYRGGDEYSVVEGILGRRFPIHQEQPPSKPTGKVRQIQYKLHPGEAGWQLKVDQVVEF